MKLTSNIFLAGIFFLSLFTACSNDGDSARDAAIDRVDVPSADPAAQSTTPSTPEPAQNAAGVWHYTCPNGCAGGSGSATACPGCGATLAHNSAYHNNAGTPATTPSTGSATSLPEGITPVPNPTQQEPAQNASGVWHYTCSNGCAGGAGSAVACSKCGSTLAHNQAYHQ